MSEQSEQRQGDYVGGDKIDGDKFGGNKYIYNGGKPEPSVEDGYAWLQWLAQAYAVVALDTSAAAQTEQRVEAVLRRLDNSAEDAQIHMRWLRRLLVAGVMAGAQNGLPAEPLAAPDAPDYTADILWPLLAQVPPPARRAVSLMLATLDADGIALVFDRLAPGYDSETDEQRRGTYRERLELALVSFDAMTGIRALLSYLAARQIWTRGARDWQRGRTAGVVSAPGLAQVTSVRISNPSVVTALASVAASAPVVRATPHLVRTKTGSLSVPISSEQWQSELVQRDEHFGAHGLQHDPVPYWCYLPGGRYRVGGWQEGDAGADLDLLPFWLGRAPITVAQFAPFVQVGYQAAAEPWWTANGWQWRQAEKRTQPDLWDDAQFNGRYQPVVGVSWYEAAAFCGWLGAQLGTHLPPNYELRLPTEAEWETAAAFAGQDKQRPTYPWGDEAPTAEYALYGLDKEGKPGLVGSYPKGAAACGALDLGGNVWEWTASKLESYPQHSAMQEKDFTPGELNIPLRGGSYRYNSTYVRCGARDRYYPGDGDGSIGFRVVVAPRRVR